MFNAHLHLAQIPFIQPDPSISGASLSAARSEEWDEIKNAQPPIPLVRSYGVHPWFVRSCNEETLNRLRTHLQDDPKASVGEIGLCGLRRETSPTEQQTALEAQLKIANEFERPVVLHGHRRWIPLLFTLRKLAPCDFMLHAFNGTPEELKIAIDQHAYFSVGSTFLSPNTRRLRELIALIPEDHLLVETDIAPVDRLSAVVKGLADIRKTTYEHLAEVTERNAQSFFRLTH